MNKAQRKREAKEKKARAKAARKAKNLALREAKAANGSGETTAPVDAGTASACRDARGTSAGKDAHITQDAHGTGAGRDAHITPAMTQEELRADPELMEAVLASQHRDDESFELMDTAHEAERELKWARGKVKEAHAIAKSEDGDSPVPGQSPRRITDQRALEMLEDAAEATHEVLLMVRDALRGVSPERREAARAILNEKPQSGVDGRKLPRRAPDPVVTLERLSLQASSLLKRILAKTNPGVGKKAA